PGVPAGCPAPLAPGSSALRERRMQLIPAARHALRGCLLFALVALLALLGCSPSPRPTPQASPPPWFRDITEEWGLDFVHDPGPTAKYFTPQSMGSGCAFILEADGTLYVYLLHNAGPKSGSVNRLYRRRADGAFADVTAGSGLDVAGFGMGVAVGDVNNDGR